jgi:RND family efflux transporter MFP subunit
LLPSPLHAREWAGSGITEPFRDAIISSTVSGTISEINVSEGDFVHGGDLIVELDSTLEKLEVERRKLIADSKVDLEAASQQVEMMKKDYESTKKLFDETQSISEQEVFRKELEYMVAQAEYDRLSISEELEEFEYKIAETQLKKRMITAPFDGVIIEVMSEVGENCSPQQPLVRIADTLKVRLVVYVEPQVSRRIRQGLRVTINIEDSGTTIVRRGVVEFISPVIDASSGLREVKVLFDNPDGSVPPGATGSLILE